MTEDWINDKEPPVLSGDEKLVERCLHGDEAAWELVVKAYGKRIYNLSYRYTNRTDVSEDLTQDIFVRIYRNLRSYRAEAGSFRAGFSRWHAILSSITTGNREVPPDRRERSS